MCLIEMNKFFENIYDLWNMSTNKNVWLIMINRELTHDNHVINRD